ncbi:hypothetical protein AB0D97_35940 [Streptomyces roseus]|uniref:hypothetical protein n=1 Tax=Streptomyces roseus TaxID=66430 RepID=UPI00340147AB
MNGTTRRRWAVVTAAATAMAMAMAMAVPVTLGAAGGAGAAGDPSIVFARYTAAAPTEDLYAISPVAARPSTSPTPPPSVK